MSIQTQMNLLVPSKLNKGDLIGVVSPASPIDDASRIERGVRYLEGLGYRVLVGSNVGKTKGYLAGTDEERAADLHAMFSNKQVKAVISVRGGYGTPRLLRLLNYRLIARNPKIFVGFSDITALHLALWKKCRMITFHGPMLGVDMATGMDHFTEELFWQTVTSEKKLGKVSLADELPAVALHPGSSSGRLLGGNLSLIVSLLGTPFQPEFTRSVLFIEEVGEEPYRIDRMLTQLNNASILAKSRAILTGQFSDCQPKDPSKPSSSVEELLREIAFTLRRPFLSNLPFGHVARKMTLPIGIRVKVDATSGILEYLESSVR